jgi:UDP-N-acetylglucosamine 2-epimerase (non-hydrolysing)
LIKEGLSPDLIIKTGSPMPEVLNFYKDKIGNSEILKSMDLKKHEYFLVSMHREENVENQKCLQGFLLTLNALSETTKMPIVVSTHPRTHKHISFSGINLNKQVILARPFAFTDYINLQVNSKAVLSDSGTISEESSILNFPALNIRESHERPEAMEETAVIMVGFNNERILQGLALLEKQSRGVNRTLNLVTDYNSQNISEKILRIIYSYTDYVNRVIWKKY